jgi:hypothetical protein
MGRGKKRRWKSSSGRAKDLIPGNRLTKIAPRSEEIEETVRAARRGTLTRLGRIG